MKDIRVMTKMGEYWAAEELNQIADPYLLVVTIINDTFVRRTVGTFLNQKIATY